MNRARLLWRSLCHFRAANLGVLAGVAVAAMVLTAALLVGDSVQATLRQQALLRIGGVELSVGDGARPFRQALAEALAPTLAPGVAAPVLQLRGVASSADDRHRELDVQVLGVDRHFFALAPVPNGAPSPAAGEVWLNRHLAAQLQAAVGAPLVLRVQPASGMARESVLAGAQPGVRALAVRVGGVVDDAHFGRYGLVASSLPQPLALLSLAWLQEQLGLPGRANRILLGGGVTLAAATAAVRAHWQLEDAGLSTRTLAGGEVELDSDAVLLPPPVVAALRQLPQPAMGVFTWLFAELRAGERRAAYVLTAALGPATASRAPGPWRGVLPAGLGDDGIVLSSWLAADLGARPGDVVQATSWQLSAQQQLVQVPTPLRVAAVVEPQGLAADRELMPPFPGLAGASSCRDWQAGVPLDRDLVSPRDEQWWQQHGGTPKAFVSLPKGQQLWADPRFGALTAVRIAVVDAPALLQSLREAIDPAALGLVVRDVRGPALAASAGTTDFSGMFVGLSFFLILAALLLTALLLGLAVLQRAPEIGTLLAVGWRPVSVRRLLLAEATVLAAGGAVLGALLAPLQAYLLLRALDSLWSDAVAGAQLTLHVSAKIVGLGAGITFAAALLACWLVLRLKASQPVLQLLTQRGGVESIAAGRPRARLSIVTMAVAVALTAWGVTATPTQLPAAAFLSGVAALVAGIAACRLWLQRRAAAGESWSLQALARANLSRRRTRSLASVALLGSGAFLVVVVGANRLQPPADASVRASGTGGFQLLGRSSLPIVGERAAGRAAFRLAADQPPGIDVVPLRVHDGDDASCLNLAQPQQPRLCGVDASALASRGAFAFSRTLATGEASPWQLLQAPPVDGAIPAIGDAGSLQWSLHKQLGDVVDYTDEQGRPFAVRLVAALRGSILEGSLVIDEQQFLRRFPSTPGYRMFLVDAPPAEAAIAAASLMHDLADAGLELVSTRERLRELAAVQNTWLSVFFVLGGLGLVLGSVGLGVVLLRNVAERRAELAALQALGWRRHTVVHLLATEHARLLVVGALCGAGAGLVTVLLQLRTEAFGAPMVQAAALVAAMLVGGLAVVWWAASRALRRCGPAELAGA